MTDEARKKVKGAQKKKEQAKKEEVEVEVAEGEAVKEKEDNSGESKAEVEFPLFQKHPFGFQDYLTTSVRYQNLST
ncbi:glucan endo-1,3-beta-glucosidase 3-like [Pyrus ussuriensis x Pyrus communis]|uniref:Glucan endo-1,3-beta-glucosidase 3-like n=1 Tax=Pyrus ussuriensis x Pyrus communis TaxID=2448454 RepID=A0A5N5HTY1_9ROSA|nr:glucan endo-1,3-beta-glucosidase 3-like [Pyrus ussuriensis x Pyrus communis]